MTLLLNYGHPLTEEQLARTAALLGETPTVRYIPFNIDRERALAEVAVELADASQLSPEAWQTTPIVINPPGLAPLAAALLAEIHGRMGGFPAMLNIRPVSGSTPTIYEVAEIVNLQAIRDSARLRR